MTICQQLSNTYTKVDILLWCFIWISIKISLITSYFIDGTFSILYLFYSLDYNTKLSFLGKNRNTRYCALLNPINCEYMEITCKTPWFQISRWYSNSGKKYIYRNLISQILMTGQICIDVYSIWHFKRDNFCQIRWRYMQFRKCLSNADM